MTTFPPVASAHETLPLISPKPTAYAGCCLALSIPLLVYLRSLLPPRSDVVLSIGSGYGLLEALLIDDPYNANVIGVEVEPSSNKYLLEAHHRAVRGSRFLEPLAAKATVWLFVYPRRVGLVQEYLAQHGGNSVRRVVWAGPKADWQDYEVCFRGWHVQITSANQVGGRAWELVAVADKTP